MWEEKLTYLEKLYFKDYKRDYELIILPTTSFSSATCYQMKDGAGKRYIVITAIARVNDSTYNPLMTSIHELSHVLLEFEKRNEISAYQDYFKYYGQHYSYKIASPQHVFEEYAIRALNYHTFLDWGNPDFARRLLNNEVALGWTRLPEFIKAIETYKNNRQKYPDIYSYLPDMLKYLKDTPSPQSTQGMPPGALKNTVVICGRQVAEIVKKYVAASGYMGESYALRNLDQGTIDQSLIIIVHVPGYEGIGGGEEKFGYRLPEIEQGIAGEGRIVKVYQAGKRTTIVFGARDLDTLDSILKGFDFTKYAYE